MADDPNRRTRVRRDANADRAEANADRAEEDELSLAEKQPGRLTKRRESERGSGDDLTRVRAELDRRASQEAALHSVTTAVVATFTLDDIVHSIVHGAHGASGADGAYVERIDVDRYQVEVAAVAGDLTPRLGERLDFRGSYTERALRQGRLEKIQNLSSADRGLPGDLAERCGDGAAIVVPLMDAGEALGAFFLIRAAESGSFQPDEIARAQIFGHLAGLATRKVHLLEDSQARREELEDALEYRSDLVRGFSHDLKNPLGAADGQAAILNEGAAGEFPSQVREGIGRIRSSLRSAIELIDDMVELARVETGRVETTRQVVDVREIVRELVLEYVAQAKGSDLTIDTEFPDEFPLSESDAGRVRQILGNLLSNAIKYTPEGGNIAVQVLIREADGAPAPKAGRWICVDVADTGPGISAEDQKRLFREFTRLETAGTEGAGLGLAISRRIARLLEGDITLDSEPGEGSTFTLWLPMSEHQS